MITLESYLQDSWQQGEGEGRPLANPTTGETIARTSTQGLDMGAAVHFAREVGGAELRRMTFKERGYVLMQVSKALHEAREMLIECSMKNGGTPRGDAKFDIDGAIGTLAHYARLGEELGDVKTLVEGEGEALTRSPRFWGHHIKLPKRGVAVHINAFNFPAWGLAEKAAVAWLAGVPVISKPATATALVAYRCAQTIVGCSALPTGAFQFVCGGAGDLLDHLGGQDTLAFTGSSGVGAKLRGHPNVVASSVKTNVEADSLNATVLANSAEAGTPTYDRFVRDIVKEVTQKTGQKCTAVRRVFVPAARIDEVVERLSEEFDLIKVGKPELDEVRVGPLASKQQLDDVTQGVAQLIEGGAKVVYRTEPFAPIGVESGKGYFFPTTLLTAPLDTAIVHELEVFGPVTTLVPYETAADAARGVALGGGGLIAAIYGDDRNELRELIEEISPFTGRVLVCSKKIADQSISPGTVLPSCVHGGPGRAGGGEELGGLRGLDFYMQRTSVQGDRALLDKLLR